ncbi:phosphopantetheine-binding protein [Catellatospora vulcania]|uniref:phosphopantetheine-binding protein n=1 Tax=Catellatospora vulcania TaxID=1460450 RepID=UPI0012D389B2|nr:phosphopantetheine-binding protein [Catellatospora vulcania]
MSNVAEPDREKIAILVTETITAILPLVTPDQIREDIHLMDLGADSVDRVEIIMLLIERCGLNEPMSSFSAIPDIGALIDFVRERKRR